MRFFKTDTILFIMVTILFCFAACDYSYNPIDEQPLYTRDGDYIYFGTYPQSEVTDESLTATLTSRSGILPTENNSANWISYGYYLEGEVADFMWYIDILYSGSTYRGVYFISYRRSWTDDASSSWFSYQDDNGYNISEVHWFKYEPIKWRILSESDGEALILCEMIIDSQEYCNSTSSRTIDGNTVMPNNYAYSNIRTFLNESFYNTAFFSLQKELILLTEIDNSERSANVDNDVTYINGGKNVYACANTNDYIFLLSEQEVTTASYGFNTSSNANDSVRQKKTTAYAQCQGAYTDTSSSDLGNGWWWLRSPYYEHGISARGVYGKGYTSGNVIVNKTDFGVVPALKIKLN